MSTIYINPIGSFVELGFTSNLYKERHAKKICTKDRFGRWLKREKLSIPLTYIYKCTSQQEWEYVGNRCYHPAYFVEQSVHTALKKLYHSPTPEVYKTSTKIVMSLVEDALDKRGIHYTLSRVYHNVPESLLGFKLDTWKTDRAKSTDEVVVLDIVHKNYGGKQTPHWQWETKEGAFIHRCSTSRGAEYKNQLTFFLQQFVKKQPLYLAD